MGDLTWKEVARFWSRVNTRRAGCWEWLGAKNNTGYGTFAAAGGTYCAHRVAAYLAGLVPTLAAPANRRGDGFVMHCCDNPGCCNPAHFTIGTYSKNQKDCYARGRANKAKGARHANAKLTDAQVAEIRKRYDAGGVRQIDLAAEYSVSQRVISKVVRRETYL